MTELAAFLEGQTPSQHSHQGHPTSHKGDGRQPYALGVALAPLFLPATKATTAAARKTDAPHWA